MSLASPPLKVVIRLPGFVDEAAFLSALASDAERERLQNVPFYAFVKGKPTSKTLAKRASLCWIAFVDRGEATAFWQTNAATLSFRDPESGKPLGVQFDFALVQRVPDVVGVVGVRAVAQSAPTSWGDDERDFRAFRTLYDAGQTPMLDAVITTEAALNAAIDSSRASFPVATAAAANAAAAAAAPPPQARIVAEYIARKRAANAKVKKQKQPVTKKGGKKK